MHASADVSPNRSQRRCRTFKFATLLVSVGCGLAICEIVLRLIGYSFPTFYTTDPDRGFRLRPNAAGWYQKEGNAYIRINSEGLRDREHSRLLLPNTLRIAVVGDSFTEALQVPLEQTFWAILERRLKSCPAMAAGNIEVLNFGVSGYSTAQELITVQRDVFEYAPDVVILVVTTNNDITDNSRALKGVDEIPYFIFRDGQLVLDDSFQNSRAFRLRSSFANRMTTWLREHCRVLQLIHHAHYAFKARLQRRQMHVPQQESFVMPAAKDANTSILQENHADLGIDNLIYRPPINAEWDEAWRVTEALIVMMSQEVKNHGAKFVVVVGSNGPQVLPKPATRAEILLRVGGTDIFYPDTRLRELGEREGIPVITLAPELQAYAEQHNIYLHGFGDGIGNGHWNTEGHRVAGELLAPRLCNELSR